MFQFVRHIKGYGSFADACAAWDDLAAIAPSWWETLDVMEGRESEEDDHGYENEEHLFEGFCVIWDVIRVPEGHDVVSSVLRLADESPVSLVGLWPRAGQAAHRLASALAWLQVSRGLEPIFFPREKWGPLLGCTPQRVSTLCRRMLQLDLLRVVAESSRGQGAAATYRFNLASFPEVVAILEDATWSRMRVQYAALTRWTNERATRGTT